MHTNLRETLEERVLIGDGAFGILLQERGICEDEGFALANLTHPEEVSRIHEDYIEAGAKVIQTNTSGASPPPLSPSSPWMW